LPRELLETLRAQLGLPQWWQGASQLEIVAGALLVQRTTWSNAARAVETLRDRALLSVDALAAIESNELATLIRPAGFYRTKATRLKGLARFIASHGGLATLDTLPTDVLRRQLLAQPGVGPETADVILGYAFGRAVFVVDAYARRLFERLDGSQAGLSDGELKERIERGLPDAESLNELHSLIVSHGKRYCRSKPCCDGCPLSDRCQYFALEES
jgi:endonuclease-3 related protein